MISHILFSSWELYPLQLSPWAHFWISKNKNFPDLLLSIKWIFFTKVINRASSCWFSYFNMIRCYIIWLLWNGILLAKALWPFHDLTNKHFLDEDSCILSAADKPVSGTILLNPVAFCKPMNLTPPTTIWISPTIIWKLVKWRKSSTVSEKFLSYWEKLASPKA